MENDTCNFKKRMACTLNLLSFLPDQEEYNQIVVIPTHFYLNLTQRRKTKMGIWTTFFLYKKLKYIQILLSNMLMLHVKRILIAQTYICMIILQHSTNQPLIISI